MSSENQDQCRYGIYYLSIKKVKFSLPSAPFLPSVLSSFCVEWVSRYVVWCIYLSAGVHVSDCSHVCLCGGHTLMMSIFPHFLSILFLDTGPISEPEAYQFG